MFTTDVNVGIGIGVALTLATELLIVLGCVFMVGAGLWADPRRPWRRSMRR